jgi:hypothetical protein
VIHTRGESFDARDGAAAIAVEPGSGVVTVPEPISSAPPISSAKDPTWF